MWWWAVARAAAPEPSGALTASEPEAAPVLGVGAALGPWIVAAEGRPADFDTALDVHGGVALAPPLWVVAELPLAATAGGVRWAPRAAVQILAPLRRFRPGVLAGLGVQGASSTDPEIHARGAAVPHWGVSASFRTPYRPAGPWVRVDARHALESAGGGPVTHHVGAYLGLEWLPAKSPAPEPVVVAEPPPPPPPVPAFDLAPTTDVWISHPLCAWASTVEAPALIATAPGPVTVVAEGFRPMTVDPKHQGPLELVPLPTGGGLVIAATPGDHVYVGATRVPAPGGLAVVSTDEPSVRVRVEGGGRSVETELAPADGWAVWYRPPRPPMWEVRFDQGSATVTAEGRARIAALAEHLGDQVYTLRGSYSPEGASAANQALAEARAERVRAALVEAGAEPSRLRVLPVEALATDDPAAARVVLVSASAPEVP